MNFNRLIRDPIRAVSGASQHYASQNGLRRTMFTTTTSDINIGTASRMSREKLAERMLEAGSLPSDTAVIDVRDDDHVGGHIKGSLNVPSSQLDYRIPELVRKLKDKEQVIFHCALSQVRGPKAAMNYLKERRRLLKDDVEGAGQASEEQAEELRTEGAKKAQQVFVLDGGFTKWQEKYGKDAKLTDAYAEDIWAD